MGQWELVESWTYLLSVRGRHVGMIAWPLCFSELKASVLEVVVLEKFDAGTSRA